MFSLDVIVPSWIPVYPVLVSTPDFFRNSCISGKIYSHPPFHANIFRVFRSLVRLPKTADKTPATHTPAASASASATAMTSNNPARSFECVPCHKRFQCGAGLRAHVERTHASAAEAAGLIDINRAFAAYFMVADRAPEDRAPAGEAQTAAAAAESSRLLWLTIRRRRRHVKRLLRAFGRMLGPRAGDVWWRRWRRRLRR